MNESLASTLVTNLLKNAYLHTAEGGAVGVDLRDRTQLAIWAVQTGVAGRPFGGPL